MLGVPQRELEGPQKELGGPQKGEEMENENKNNGENSRKSDTWSAVPSTPLVSLKLVIMLV